jgi:flap endonuclease GEN
VVDGVISNDGDCLLFGAKVVYTKFSVENLQNSQVIRYDASNFAAIVDDENDEHREKAKSSMISLSRLDLIAFALLTGSDLAGNGLPKVGHKRRYGS